MTDIKVWTRAHLLDQGVSRGHIDYQVDSGRWLNPHRGVYVPRGLPETDRLMTLAHLAACGPTAVLSHHTAAALHGFDSTDGWGISIHILAARTSGTRSNPPNLRVWHTQADVAIETIAGFPVTSRARTVFDLAAVLDDVECERVLESALRGDNRKRPDIWRTDVLDELLELHERFPRHKGASRVRRLLILRPPGCRPTGSFAETVLLQALRVVGVEPIRQPSVRVIDSQTKRWDFFPDFLVVSGKSILEVEGSHHLEPATARADAARQNRLVGFRVFRYPATTIFSDPLVVAREVARHAARVGNTATSWTEAGRQVNGEGNLWTVRDFRR